MRFCLFEEFNLTQVPEKFWKSLDDVASSLEKNSNFSPFWDLTRKFPSVFPDADHEHFSEVYDRYLVRAHNRNIITKIITFGDWLYLTMSAWREMYKVVDKQTLSFSEWYLNGLIKLYRGTQSIPSPLEKNEFKSFTVDKEMAIKFTQPGWSTPKGSWVYEKQRNGYVAEVEIPVKSVHFFNNVGHEMEAIVKGPVEFSNVYVVKAGKIAKGK